MNIIRITYSHVPFINKAFENLVRFAVEAHEWNRERSELTFEVLKRLQQESIPNIAAYIRA